MNVNMVTDTWRNPVQSLISLSIDYILKNIAVYANENIDQLKVLPPNIKNRILRKFTGSSYFWKKVNFKDVLCNFVNEYTTLINLTLATIDDDILKILSSCKNLKKLYLTRTGTNKITSLELKNTLKCMSQLYILIITNCDEVDDDVLRCLTEHCPYLTGLDVGGCKNITDKGVEELSTLKNLRWLTISQTQISDEGISYLVNGNSGKNIRDLNIDNCPNVTEIGLKAIAENCPDIENLVFYNCSTTINQVIFQEGQLKHLKQMSFTIPW